MASKNQSKILGAVHESARGLHDAGALDDLTMRRFDAICLPPVPSYKADDIRRIRKEAKTSQAVFALVLNVGKATVAAWEQGGKEPSGSAMKLLDLVNRKGLSALI